MMISQEDSLRLRKLVFDLVGFSWDGEIHVREGRGMTVTARGCDVTLSAESKPALARAYFRFAQEKSAGAGDLDIHEEKQFESCGPFLDFSRNGVMTVAACKRYMDCCAALGMNLFILYTEDTYEVPEYPYMGYLRGRYSQDELRELDLYARGLGIELVPCIQALGHLENFLQWAQNRNLRDQPAVLMIDEEETYRFLEAAVRSLRGAVSSRRLHIGMDEAHGIGLGNYFYKHGPTDRFQLLKRHLDRVAAICRKYGFEPMMWSDMFFRLGSKTNAYYDMEADIPQSVIDTLPDVGLVYWDYYHQDGSFYEKMLTQHEKMGKNTIFAGGIWTWSGFLPQVELTFASMEPGLKACARHKVRTVMATMWGDDGQETVHSLALSQLPLFSESCWRPEEMTRELVLNTGAFLTGLPREAYEAFALFYPGAEDRRPGKAVIWCDLLYPLGPAGEELAACVSRSEQALSILAPLSQDLRCRYAASVFEVVRRKGKILAEIRNRYLNGDRAWLRQAAEETIPALMDAYRALREAHRAIWESEFKRNGWEVLALRYGAVLGRLEDVCQSLKRYAEGELDTLCELDEAQLDPDRGAQFFEKYVTPMAHL